MRSQSGFPRDLGDEEELADVAGEDEQVVAEAVQVAEYEGFDEELLVLEANAGAFCAAADAAGDVGGGYCDMAAGKQEGFHRR